MEENNFEFSESHYSNAQIHSDALPKIEHLNYESIPKAALYVSLMVAGIILLVILLAASIVILLIDDVQPYGLMIIGGILLFFAFIFFIELKAFKYRGFALREHDIAFREGWLWKSTIIVPYNRVQHLEVHQGPIDKLFDLAAINIFTAGGSSSDLEIDGLHPEQAANIKAYILSKTNNLFAKDESE